MHFYTIDIHLKYINIFLSCPYFVHAKSYVAQCLSYNFDPSLKANDTNFCGGLLEWAADFTSGWPLQKLLTQKFISK